MNHRLFCLSVVAAAPTLAVAADAAPMFTAIKEAESSLGPTRIGLIGLATLGIVYLVLIMSLQLSCWFALVPTTFKRCALLTILLFCPTFISALISVWTLSDAHGQFRPERFIITGIVWFFALLLCGYSTRRVLECRWRSVVTVYVMFNLSAHIMIAVTAGIALVLLTAFGFAMPS